MGLTGLTGCTGRTGLMGLMGRTDTARIAVEASGMLDTATKRNKYMKILLDHAKNRCMI